MKSLFAFFLCFPVCLSSFAQVTPAPNIVLSKITPGSQIGSPAAIVNNNWTLLDNYFGGVYPTPPMALVYRSLNASMISAAAMKGVDASCKIQAAISAAPPGGGIVDAYDLQDPGGTGSCNIDPGTKAITLLLGPYTYNIRNILLRTNFHILGSGSGNGVSNSKQPTRIQAVGDNGTPPFSLTQVANEGQEDIILRDLFILGAPGNTSQNGVFIKPGGPNAGMWYSEFDNLNISGFSGIGLDFEAPVTAAPAGINQFNTFKRLIVARNVGGSFALQIKGYNNSLKFENCEFDGSFTGKRGGDGLTNINIDDFAGGVMPPYNIKFDLLTTQWAGIAVQILAGDMISIDQGHFEGVFNAITTGTGAGGSFGSLGVTIHDSGFYNGTGINGGKGSIINQTASTRNVSIQMINSHIYTVPDSVLKGNKASVAMFGNTMGPEGSYVYLPPQSGAPDGFGTGKAGTVMTTTTQGAGTGPTTPQTVVRYQQVTIGGVIYWVPLVQ